MVILIHVATASALLFDLSHPLSHMTSERHIFSFGDDYGDLRRSTIAGRSWWTPLLYFSTFTSFTLLYPFNSHSSESAGLDIHNDHDWPFTALYKCPLMFISTTLTLIYKTNNGDTTWFRQSSAFAIFLITPFYSAKQHDSAKHFEHFFDMSFSLLLGTPKDKYRSAAQNLFLKTYN